MSFDIRRPAEATYRDGAELSQTLEVTWRWRDILPHGVDFLMGGIWSLVLGVVAICIDVPIQRPGAFLSVAGGIYMTTRAMQRLANRTTLRVDGRGLEVLARPVLGHQLAVDVLEIVDIAAFQEWRWRKTWPEGPWRRACLVAHLRDGSCAVVVNQIPNGPIAFYLENELRHMLRLDSTTAVSNRPQQTAVQSARWASLDSRS